MVGQGVQAVGVVAVAAAKAGKHHVAGFVQHVAQRAAAAEFVGGAVIQRPALRGGGEIAQVIVGPLQMGQVGDKALGAIDTGGGDVVAVIVPQLQPDIAVALVVHHDGLLAFHRLHGGVGDEFAGVGVIDFQAVVFGVEGNGIVRDTAGVQRRHFAGLKVVQVIAVVAVCAPGDHIPREEIAGQVIKGANDAAVLGGHVPQLIPAVRCGKAGHVAAAGLGKARKTLASGRVIERLLHRLAVGVIGVQFHPVAQAVAGVRKARGRGAVGPVELCAVLCEDDDPAVEGGIVVPCVIGKALRAGVAGVNKGIAVHAAAVSALRHRQTLAGGKVDDLAGAAAPIVVPVFAVDKAALLQHQQAVLQRGALLAVKGQDLGPRFVVEGTAASAPACGVRPAAEPVVRLAGDRILQKGHVFTAGGLVQHLTAAEDGRQIAGIVVAVKHPQPAVVQPGSIVQRFAACIGGHGSCRCRFAGSRRQHRTAAAQCKAQGHAQGSAAQAGRESLHKIHSFANPKHK